MPRAQVRNRPYSAVGCLVGLSDGAGVGASVGVPVGPAVGAFVGGCTRTRMLMHAHACSRMHTPDTSPPAVDTCARSGAREHMDDGRRKMVRCIECEQGRRMACGVGVSDGKLWHRTALRVLTPDGLRVGSTEGGAVGVSEGK